MELPTELSSILAGHSFEPIVGGESGAAIWRCMSNGSRPLYLKSALLALDLQLDQEAARLRWMVDRETPVPRVRGYYRLRDSEYLLLDEVRGIPASDSTWTSAPQETVLAIADALQRLHQTSIASCPFDHRVARRIEAARMQLARGRVREDDFDENRAGRRATDLFAELVSTVPSSEDLVFTHGDCCLPNIILQRQPEGDVAIAGFIDCGRAGAADRYQDLALAARSITYNYGAEWLAPFFRRYGLDEPDAEKLSFFTLLDEFF